MARVSVILSVFNGEKYLAEAIHSVLDNGYDDIEFLVVDDGSSDGSLELLSGLQAEDARLKVFTNGVNKGTGYSFSRLLELASGEYVAAIGQDDRWEPGFLEACVALLDGQPEVSVAFSDVNIISSQGESLSPQPQLFRTDLVDSLTREDLMVLLVKFNFLCAASAVFRKSLVAGWHTFGYNDQLQDWNLWQHLILKGEFRTIGGKRVSYRVHGQNLSIGNSNPMQVKVELWQTRLEMIGSPAFADFILAARDPEGLLFTAMTAYSELIHKGNSLAYQGLLQALRRNEHRLCHLEAFRGIMAVLFLYTGAMTKAGRYTPAQFRDLRCPKGFLQAFGWRWYLLQPAISDLPARSPFLRIRNIGFLKVVRAFVPKQMSPMGIGLLGDMSSTLEQSLERHLFRKERRRVRYY